MKVRELIELLAACDPDSEVILQRDSEGNGYSPLSGADAEAVYVPENSWGGAVFSSNWTADDAGMEESEWEELMRKQRCVVLYPVN